MREWYRQPLSDPDELVGLETELPLRVREAVLERELSVAGEVRAVHWLEVEVPEVVCFEALRWSIRLGIDKLQFAAAPQDCVRTGRCFLGSARVASRAAVVVVHCDQR